MVAREFTQRVYSESLLLSFFTLSFFSPLFLFFGSPRETDSAIFRALGISALSPDLQIKTESESEETFHQGYKRAYFLPVFKNQKQKSEKAKSVEKGRRGGGNERNRSRHLVEESTSTL
jgi:hypothetical protein